MTIGPDKLALVLAAAAAMPAGVGATAPTQGGPPAGWVRVQQGVADAGPLHVDLRVQPVELRAPMDYDSVYRGTLPNGYGGTTDYFARISGAVTAVFPQSVYIDAAEGVRSAVVPPGTVYYIGELPEELTGKPQDPVRIPQRRPTPLSSAPDFQTEVPFDVQTERILAERRAKTAADLILQAAAAEKSRIAR